MDKADCSAAKSATRRTYPLILLFRTAIPHQCQVNRSLGSIRDCIGEIGTNSFYGWFGLTRR